MVLVAGRQMMGGGDCSEQVEEEQKPTLTHGCSRECVYAWASLAFSVMGKPAELSRPDEADARRGQGGRREKTNTGEQKGCRGDVAEMR